MHPPAVKGRPEEGGQLEVPKLPLSFDPHVLFSVSGRSPYRLVPFSIGAGLEKVPDPLGPVAINLNDRIHYHMHREGKPLGSPNKEVTNLIPSFSRAPLGY